jgi:tetratricopeptide (TPR) repeat protein
VLTLASACDGIAVGPAFVGAAIPTEEVLTPLHVAAERGHVAVVRLMLPLMSQGDVDSSAWGGCAPLHDAAGHGHTVVVKCLLDAAADPELSDEGGWGALHYASSEGHNDTVECLLRAGARTDKTDRNGCTPIHYAAGEGYVNVLTSLVQAGAHVDAQALSGWTPLHYAAQSGRYKTARALLDAGASRSICAAQGGQLAKAVAMEHGHGKVLSLLKDYVRQSAKLVMALQRLAWARCQISCRTLADNGPAYILSAELVQQVTRRYKHAPPSAVVRRAEAESHLLWQLKGVQALERRGLADAKKQAGNQFYREKQFDKALKCYSEALAIDPTNHLYYCNLSAATATLGLWEESASAARRCLQLSPGFVKAHIRLATAEMNLGRYDEAVAAVEVGLQQQSNGSRSNPSLRRLLSELREKDPAIQFARARVARREQLQKPRRNSVSTVGSVSTVPDTYDGGKNEYGGGAGGSQASHDSGGAAALTHRHSVDRDNYQPGGDARSVGGESVAFSDLAISDITSQAGADSIEDSLEADGELAYLQEMPSEEEDEQDDLQAFGDGDTSDGGFSQGARSRLSNGGFFQPEPERSGAADTLERHETVRRGWVRLDIWYCCRVVVLLVPERLLAFLPVQQGNHLSTFNVFVCVRVCNGFGVAGGQLKCI